jgi:hypothetical protein
MAIKFVDEADLTTVGNAIRAKTGGSGLLTFPEGMAAAIAGIEAGADLPTLTNPAGAGDIAAGKQAIRQDGGVVTGSVPTPNSVTLEDGTVEAGVSIGGGGVFLATGTMATDNLLRAGKTVQVSVAASEFGNAEAADVAAGKTFTSAAGLEAVGTSTAVETGDATAAAGEILSGKTAYVNGQKVTGSMPNQGAKNQALNCGSSYPIPAGYHNGSGVVTTHSLASQTEGTATAADIASGKTAWVNGERVTGAATLSGLTSIVDYSSELKFNQEIDVPFSEDGLLYIKTLSGEQVVLPMLTIYTNNYSGNRSLDLEIIYTGTTSAILRFYKASTSAIRIARPSSTMANLNTWLAEVKVIHGDIG